MRVAGALTVVATVMVAAVFCLWPVRLSTVGTTYSCLPPAGEVALGTNSGDPDVDDECHRESIVRVGLAGTLLLIGVVGGWSMIAVGRPDPR